MANINHSLIPPTQSISQFMGYLKGKSALMMFDRHANLKYKFGNRRINFFICPESAARSRKMAGACFPARKMIECMGETYRF